MLRCDIHGHLPSGTVPGSPDEAETGRLRSVILPALQPQVIRARNGLIPLDRGPSSIPADPGEPLAELRWEGGSQMTIQRVGRHGVWLRNQATRRTVPLGVGDIWPLDLAESGRWTVHFGTGDDVHRFVKILVPRADAE